MKYVGYITRFETELTRMLTAGESVPAVVKWASDRVFESYRNGVDVGKNAKKPVRMQSETESRPRAR